MLLKLITNLLSTLGIILEISDIYNNENRNLKTFSKAIDYKIFLIGSNRGYTDYQTTRTIQTDLIDLLGRTPK